MKNNEICKLLIIGRLVKPLLHEPHGLGLSNDTGNWTDENVHMTLRSVHIWG